MSLLSLLGIPRTTCTVLGVLLEQAVEVYPSALLLRQVFVFNLSDTHKYLLDYMY